MKRTIVNLIKTILFVMVFILIKKGFEFILIDDADSYTRVTFHEMYEQDNIDVLFLGTSHCFRCFIPSIIDEGLYVNSFNAGSSAQTIVTSKLILQEAIKYNNINHVYLEVYYSKAFENRINYNPTEVYIVTDYLKPSIDKAVCMVNTSSKEEIINAFIPARREWRELFSIKRVKNVVSSKITDDYYSYRCACDNPMEEKYVEKGYVANYTRIQNWNYCGAFSDKTINVSKITSDYKEDLNDIIEICKKNNIKLTLVSAPMSPYLLTQVGNYDDYIDFMNNIAKENGIEYIDFNLCKEEYFPNSSEVYKDVDHINDYGAKILSDTFVKYVSGKTVKDDIFYDSYEEKLKDMPLTAFGVTYEIDDDMTTDEKDRLVNYHIISNACYFDSPLFKITVVPEGGASFILQDYSSSDEFELKKDFVGKVEIYYKDSNGDEKKSVIDIN